MIITMALRGRAADDPSSIGIGWVRCNGHASDRLVAVGCKSA
jgi:hypothetical protein